MEILGVILLGLFAFITYNLLKIFVISNFKINKWIILGVLVLLSLSIFFIPQTSFIIYIVQYLYFILTIWFIDVFMDERAEKRKNKNQKVIHNKPKVKPNRMDK